MNPLDLGGPEARNLFNHFRSTEIFPASPLELEAPHQVSVTQKVEEEAKGRAIVLLCFFGRAPELQEASGRGASPGSHT